MIDPREIELEMFADCADCDIRQKDPHMCNRCRLELEYLADWYENELAYDD